VADAEFRIERSTRASGDERSVSFDVHVPANLKYLEGHFPGRPIVPGIAQLTLVARAARLAWPDLGEPSGLRRLKFSRELGPGDHLALELDRTDTDVRFVIRKEDAECSRGLLAFRNRSA
jgi:3-hydroxymyristoyl/3-hydroxydecanoyl-(acyl carrier protein) dehydratase